MPLTMVVDIHLFEYTVNHAYNKISLEQSFLFFPSMDPFNATVVSKF